VVINTAAYTAVDRAEDEPEVATEVNGRAVESIVQGVGAIGARLIQISTDYVFDGTSDGWYREADQVNPLNAYGRSKRAGELAALKLDDSLVVRTSGLYSGSGDNFVTTIRGLALAGNELDVVDDQWCCPTSADDLAQALVVAIRSGLNHSGLFHVAAPDGASWWEVADEILGLEGLREQVRLERRSGQAGRRQDDHPPVGTACRPRDSRLSSDAFAAAYEHSLPPWRESLAVVSAQLERRYRAPAEVGLPIR
jgi:dTDP-4-dehydrorhamnose reductase